MTEILDDQTLEDIELFGARPARSTNCTTCRGRGHVDRPYVLVHTPRLRGVPSGVVTATVVGTASIFEATREASEIANKVQRPVAFYFMEKLVITKPYDDPGEVARRWWREFYGETYEESVARR